MNNVVRNKPASKPTPAQAPRPRRTDYTVVHRTVDRPAPTQDADRVMRLLASLIAREVSP